LVLALFSRLLAPRQPDWPQPTVQTGFPFYDQDGSESLPEELETFLNAGPPPIVFTLGISAAMVADRFFELSSVAAQRLGYRAVLMTGRNLENRLKSLPDGMVAFEYAPFSKLFPRAAAVVHPGGIGTTGLAMRAGRPTLVVPYAHDQPDNAARVTRLGIARTIPRRRYTPDRVTSALGQLLNNPEYSQQAAVVAEQLQQEDGVQVACDALEEFLARQGRREVAG
jgi:UDP:flavonoid glycosyltransferase YjiC (YdhE family)